MGNPLGVSRDFRELEKRRMMAIGMLEQGETQAAVARRIGIAPQTMSRWVAEYRRNGLGGLKKAGRAGRKPALNLQDRERLHSLLLKGPKKVENKTPNWTCLSVARLITREFGVRYHPGHVWKILVAMGWILNAAAGAGHDRKGRETWRWKGNA